MKDKLIKELHLVFENCEGAVISIKDILVYSFQDIQNSMCKGCCSIEGSVDFYRRINSGFIIFKDLENLNYKSWGDDKNKSLFDRLTKHSDITNIDIIYNDGTSDYINVPWKSVINRYRNLFQNIKKNKYGEWYISFHRGWTLGAIWRCFKQLLKILKWEIKQPFVRFKEKRDYKRCKKRNEPHKTKN